MVAALTAIAWAAITVRPQRERELQAAYDRLNFAMKNKDLPAFMALLTPDYTEQRLSGKPERRAEAEAHYRRLFANWISIDRQIAEVDKVEAKGRELVDAVNRVTIGTARDMDGAFGPKGRTHKLIADTMDIDRWIPTDQGWKLKRRHVILARFTVDGKPLETPPGSQVHMHDD